MELKDVSIIGTTTDIDARSALSEANKSLGTQLASSATIGKEQLKLSLPLKGERRDEMFKFE